MKKKTTLTLEWQNPLEFNLAAFNPAIRTERERLTGLRENMAKNGYDDHYPVIVGVDGIVGDGHRRIAVAIDLGLPIIPFVRDRTRTSAEIWADVSDTSRPPSLKETAAAVAGGLDVIPTRGRSEIRAIISYAGIEGLRAIAEAKLSPSIHKRVKMIADYCMRKDDGEFKKKTLMWLVEHKAQMLVYYAIQDNVSYLALQEAIENNRPLLGQIRMGN